MASSLIHERPLVISPTLAATIGLEEALLLQFLHEFTQLVPGAGQQVAPALAAGLVGGALGEERDEGEAEGDDVSIGEAERAGLVVEAELGEGVEDGLEGGFGEGLAPGVQLGALEEEGCLLYTSPSPRD